MEKTAKFSSLTFNPNLIRRGLKCRRKLGSKIMASTRGRNYGGDDYHGKLVDESMIVLRMRIKEMKALEKKNDELPSNWMEWEKQYFLHYSEDICTAIGLLQNYMMNMRPSLALGMMALLTFSVSISIAIFLFRGLEIAEGIFSGFQFQ